MKLPNADLASVNISKLSDYCLNSEHPRGRHKARVFSKVLGITLPQAEELQEALLDAARTGDAVSQGKDDFGHRYRLDFVMNRAGKTATVRSLWIIRRGEGFPRFISCYVLT